MTPGAMSAAKSMSSDHHTGDVVGFGLGITADWWIGSANLAVGIHGLYCILAGFSSGLFCIITVIFWRRPTRRLTTWIFYLGSAVSLVLLNFILFVSIVVRFPRIRPAARDDLTLSQLSTISEYNDLFPQYASSWWNITSTPVLAQFFEIIFVLLSDGAIVYRAVILTEYSTTRRLLLGLGWFVCLLFGVLSLFSPQAFKLPLVNWTLRPWRPFTIGFICASVACNLSATGTIAFIAWQHHKLLRVQLGLRHARRTPSQRILATLLESGMVYCIFQVVYLVLVFVSTIGHPFHYGGIATPSQQVLQATSMGLSAMYPALVFTMANIQAACSDEHMEGFIGSMTVPQ